MLKRFIVILGVILVMLVAVVTVYYKTNFDLYTDSEKVGYLEVLDDKTTPTVYYYYQDTCHFCNSIKDQVTDMYLAIAQRNDINMKLVDARSSANSGVWGDEDYNYETADLTDPNQIKITGTPSMIYVVNGEVKMYKSGANVFDIMDQVNEDYGLGLTFDPSKYGKN